MKIVLQQLRNIQHIHPISSVRSHNENVKHQELVVRSVVDTFLHTLGTLHKVGVIGRPVAPKILSVNGKLNHFRVKLLDGCVDIDELVMILGHQLL